MKKRLTALLAVILAAFLFASCLPEDENELPKTPPPFTVIILQAYGSGDAADGAVSHSFIELYNTSTNDLSLDGYTVQAANGASASAEESDWAVLSLEGKTIKAKSSFLILGRLANPDANVVIDETKADIKWDISLSNRSFKICLIKRLSAHSEPNPFDMDGNGKKAAGYIDMLGAVNEPETDSVFGYEGEVLVGISKQKSARRISTVDTDNNSADFEIFDYRTNNKTMADYHTPKSTLYGAWSPTYTDNAANYHELAGKLMIWQAAGAKDGAVSNSFIELYNNTAQPIDLSEFFIQYAEGGGTDWSVISLAGKSIGAYSSFLILGARSNNAARLLIDANDADLISNFTLSNRSFKVCLIASGAALTVTNPFNTDGGQKSAGYIDMVGAINSSGEGDVADGFEGSAYEGISKQKSCRRKSLSDTDDNNIDFRTVDYRTVAEKGVSDIDVENFRPKNSAYGAWNPVTFEKY